MWTFCEPGSDHPHCWRQRSLTQVVFVVGHSKERCTHTGHHHTGMSVLTTCVYTLVQGCMHTPRVYTQAYVCSSHVHRYRCTQAHTCVYTQVQGCMHAPNVCTHGNMCSPHMCTHRYVCVCTHHRYTQVCVHSPHTHAHTGMHHTPHTHMLIHA